MRVPCHTVQVEVKLSARESQDLQPKLFIYSECVREHAHICGGILKNQRKLSGAVSPGCYT